MGDIGIGIKVGYTEVTAGKKALDGLKQSLEEVKDSSDFSFGSDGNAMDGANKSARKFRGELEGASSATAKMVKDYEKLIKISTSTAAKNINDGAGRVSVGHGTASDYDNALRRAAERSTGTKRKTYGEQYLEQHGNKGRTVREGVNESGKNNYDGASQLYNKIGTAVIGAVTVGSAIAFLQRARSKYIEGSVNEASLIMRGISDTRPFLGNTRTEMQHHAALLASQAGYTSNSSLRSSLKFSAATGTDPNLGIGVMASSRDLSSGGTKIGEKMLGVLLAISKSTHDSPERINRLLSGSYGLFSKAQGGAEVTVQQMANIQALVEGLHKTGPQGRQGDTMGILKNAFKSTGNPATDILKAKMLGVYDGPLDFDKVWDIKKREAQGLTSPENRSQFRKLMNDPHTSQSQKYMFASDFFPGMDPSGVESFVNDTIGGLDENALAARVKKFQSGKYGIDTSKYEGTAGAKVKRRQAEKEEMQHGAGRDIEDAADPWERRAYSTVNKAFESGVPRTVASVSGYVENKVSEYRENPKVVPESVSTPVLQVLVELLRGDSMPIISAIRELTSALTGAGGASKPARAPGIKN